MDRKEIAGSIFTLVLLIGSLYSACAFSPQKIREHFEWGEYQKLIDQLRPFFASIPDSTDSTIIADYYLYMGVALFGTGNIDEAGKFFYKALYYDDRAALERAYVTEDMINLFDVVRSDYLYTKKQKMYQDSLLVASRLAFESNVKAMKFGELQQRKRNNYIFAVSFASIGALFLGIAAYEYHATDATYRELKHAASEGDKVLYNRYYPIVNRANTIIISCDIAGGVSIFSALLFSIKARRLQKEINQ